MLTPSQYKQLQDRTKTLGKVLPGAKVTVTVDVGDAVYHITPEGPAKALNLIDHFSRHTYMLAGAISARHLQEKGNMVHPLAIVSRSLARGFEDPMLNAVENGDRVAYEFLEAVAIVAQLGDPQGYVDDESYDPIEARRERILNAEVTTKSEVKDAINAARDQ